MDENPMNKPRQRPKSFQDFVDKVHKQIDEAPERNKNGPPRIPKLSEYPLKKHNDGGSLD